ncbi:MAG: hypothetical protein ACUVWZ_11515 [Anaerolineae bacterium]
MNAPLSQFLEERHSDSQSLASSRPGHKKDFDRPPTAGKPQLDGERGDMPVYLWLEHIAKKALLTAEARCHPYLVVDL